MGNINYTRIVLGSLRYKSSPDTDLSLQVPFKSTQRELIEYDRTADINLQQVFQDERENSNSIRPSCKFQLVFKNAYTGTTRYTPFERNLYYTNAESVITDRCANLSGNSPLPWGGFPLYNEFDFIRNDYNVSGYTIPSGNTIPPSVHVNFVSKSATTYNWNFFVTYGYDNDYTKTHTAKFLIPDTNNPYYETVNWTVSDGIPFVVTNGTFNGRNVLRFRCPIKHGLNVGEYVQLSSGFTYDGNTLFQVYSLGDYTYGSEEFIFNLINYGYTGNTFNVGNKGTAKRVLNVNNVSDSISEYYVRTHKILTDVNDSLLVKTGFEENAFGNVKKYESSGFTPDGIARVSIKEGGQTYSVTFNKKIDISTLLDNQRRPLTELFFSVIWKGYFGWTMGIPKIPPQTGFYGLKQGWEFNLPLEPSTDTPSPWWSNNEPRSETNFPLGTYNTGLFNSSTFRGFTYVESLKVGDVLDGEICEWNNFEQRERVVTDIYHKIRFNPYVFSINNNTILNQNSKGYYYKPHYSLPIRVFSDYIEEGNFNNIVGVPNYAYFSTSQNTFRWRDLYPYGFVDSSGLGYDFPFLNGVHYPYNNYTFRIIPEGTNYTEQTIITQPITDNCE
jgi:hypothetical protein